MSTENKPHWLTKKHILIGSENSEMHYPLKWRIQNNLEFIWYYIKKWSKWILLFIFIPLLVGLLVAIISKYYIS